MNFMDAANFDNITKAIEKLGNKGERETDARFWQPAVDKAGNGFAEIRFLPTPPMDTNGGLPWVELYSHGFQGPSGAWYIENSLTTLGQKDPVSEDNSRLWKMGDEETARKRKRRHQFISNVYIVNDPANPENNGRVALYRYGEKIFEKIQEAMKPTFDGEDKINPFDLLKGANFQIGIVNKEGYRNYDKSKFKSASPLLKGDQDKLNEIWQKEFSLLAFIAPDQFKSYDELKKRFNEVMGGSASRTENDMQRQYEEQNAASNRMATGNRSAAEEMDDEIPFDGSSDVKSLDEDEDEKLLNHFRNLAAD